MSTQRLSAAFGKTGRVDPLQWARDLEERDRNHRGRLVNGGEITPAQREMYREALRFAESRGLSEGGAS